LETNHHEARSFAHHYGSVKRSASPERALRIFPPLGWGIGQVLPHVRRVERKSAEHAEVHSPRAMLTL
jgi:hypothetical protein